jgi:hypothetical protein
VAEVVSPAAQSMNRGCRAKEAEEMKKKEKTWREKSASRAGRTKDRSSDQNVLSWRSGKFSPHHAALLHQVIQVQTLSREISLPVSQSRQVSRFFQSIAFCSI